MSRSVIPFTLGTPVSFFVIVVHSNFIIGIPPTLPGETPLAKSQMIQPGNVLCLRDIPVGTVIHNISLKAGCRGQLCRSAGTCGQVLSTGQTGFAQVRLNSKEVRLIHVDCSATIGMVSTNTLFVFDSFIFRSEI